MPICSRCCTVSSRYSAIEPQAPTALANARHRSIRLEVTDVTLGEAHLPLRNSHRHESFWLATQSVRQPCLYVFGLYPQ